MTFNEDTTNRLSNAITDDEVILEQELHEAEARGTELLNQRLAERVERACEWHLVRQED